MANACAMEIFASHRHEEKHLQQLIMAGADEIAHLQAKVEEFEKTETGLKQGVEELRTEVRKRDKMPNFMARWSEFVDSSERGDFGCREGCCSPAAASRFGNVRLSEAVDLVAAEHFMGREGYNVDELSALYGQPIRFNTKFLNSASKFWVERASL